MKPFLPLESVLTCVPLCRLAIVPKAPKYGSAPAPIRITNLLRWSTLFYCILDGTRGLIVPLLFCTLNV
jgi:hypothetical protein